jgi:hypothetical protein
MSSIVWFDIGYLVTELAELCCREVGEHIKEPKKQINHLAFRGSTIEGDGENLQ